MSVENGGFVPPEKSQEKRDPVVSEKLLESVRKFNDVFSEHEQPVWVMGSMAIAAQRGSPHRDIVNDVDFMTTDEHINDVIDDLERRGFIVEEGWGAKFRAYNPNTETRGDFAVFHVNEETGTFETKGASFPAAGFPEEDRVLNGVSMKPISLELLYVLKKAAAQQSGGKHLIDLEAITEEARSRGIDPETLKTFEQQSSVEKMNTEGIRFENDTQYQDFEKRKAELIQQYKEAFKIMTDFENLPKNFPKVAESLIITKREGNNLEMDAQVKSFGQTFPVKMKTKIIPDSGFISDNESPEFGTSGHEELTLEKVAGGTKINYVYEVDIHKKWLRIIAKPLIGCLAMKAWEKAVVNRLKKILENRIK